MGQFCRSAIYNNRRWDLKFDVRWSADMSWPGSTRGLTLVPPMSSRIE